MPEQRPTSSLQVKAAAFGFLRMRRMLMGANSCVNEIFRDPG